MRVLIPILIFSIYILNPKIFAKSVTGIEKNGNKLTNEFTPKSLAELILKRLGITLAQFMKFINETLIRTDLWIEESIKKIGDVLEQVNPETKKAIQSLLDDSATDARAAMKPIQEQMEKIIPIISEAVSVLDLISDLIEAVLGIPLIEFLTNITDTFIYLNKLVNKTFAELNEITKGLDKESAKLINDVTEVVLSDVKKILTPLLDMLKQIIPKSVKENHIEKSLLAPRTKIIVNSLLR